MRPIEHEYLATGTTNPSEPEKIEERPIVASNLKPRKIEYASQLPKDSPILAKKISLPGCEVTEVRLNIVDISKDNIAPSATCDGVNLIPGNKGHG